MSFNERIRALIERLPGLVEHLHTEEATKNALVMPFLAALGYDVFDPKEVVPEFTADVGLKKGEKVDYAIKRDGEIILLVECKKASSDLGQADTSQLFRYFTATSARIALLTNGIHYWFYSDLDDVNKMDPRPFLELHLGDPRPGDLAEVRRLAKEEFNLDKMLSAANELKYMSILRKSIALQFEQPDEDFVRFFFGKAVPGGRFTATVKEQFTGLVHKSFSQFVTERINNRLRTALQNESKAVSREEAPPETPAPEACDDGGIVTTEEEIEAFRIVRAIVCRSVTFDRVVMRDAKTYCGILLDDNNRKPICRLWFNSRQKYLGVFDAEKNETRIPIEEITGIYNHAGRLLEAVERYEKGKSVVQEQPL